MKKEIFILTGEESGSIRAADLIKAMDKNKYNFVGVGTKTLKQAGVKIIYDAEQLSVIGFLEVLFKLPKIMSFKAMVKKYILRYKPDLIIVVDYPGFNIPFIKWLKKNKFKVVYYVLPKVWAWGKNRIKKIEKNSDLLLSIIPFETEIFHKNCYFVGNPIAFNLTSYLKRKREKKYIGLFPGSRKQEVKTLLPLLLKVASQLKGVKFIIDVPQRRKKEVERILSRYEQLDIRVNYDHYYDSLLQCSFAFIASGTATLEAALLKIPFIIVYKVNFFTSLLIKLIIKTPYVGLPNILLKQEVFPELLQRKATVKQLLMQFQYLENDKKWLNKVEKTGEKLYNLLTEKDIYYGVELIEKLLEE